MERGSIKGEKLEHNEVHRKDMEGDDKNGGRDKDKIEKHAFHARADKHPPNARGKNKKGSLACGDGEVAAEEEEGEDKKGERALVEEDDHNICDDKDALGAQHVSIENKPFAWLPFSLF
ncbi:MAG: hypothetical protein GY721_05865 [Deltaproteobacteria bacterium]|nr:hypothetical protein [Deltaproteobacteria bacterium]